MTTQTYNTDPIEKLYGVVKQKGYYTRSLDEFKTKYSTPEAIDNLYNVVNKSQLYTKSKDEFLNQYFPTKKKVGGSVLPSEVPSTSKTEESGLVPLDVDVEAFEKDKLRREAINNPKLQITEEEISIDPIKAANRVIHNKITNLTTPQATTSSTYVKPPMETQLAEPGKRFTYSDAKKDIDRLNKDFFASKEQIDQYLVNNQDKGEDNLTKQLALKRKNDFDKLEGALHGASSLDEAALRYAANNGDQSIKYLLDQGGGNLIGESEETSNVPMSVRGEKLLQLLSNKDFRSIVSKNPNLKTEFNEAIANFPNRYPQYASRLLGEAIARKRDEKGLNNKFANIVSKETTDEIVKELFESGDFPTNYQFVYEKEIRPKLGTWQSIGRGIGQAIGLGQAVNDAPIPTSGFLESAGQSFENVYTSTAKTLADLSMAGSQSALDAARTEPQQVADVLKKQAETPQFEPTKFWDKVTSHSGGLAGFVAGLGGGTGALKAINLIKNPAMASTAMMVLGTHGDTQDKAKIYSPNDKMTQFVYTGAMDGLNAALGKFLPGTQIPRLLSKGEGSVAEVLKKMVSGDISTGAAKDKVLQWFGDSIKGTLHGAEFMGAISAADEVLSQTLQGKDLNLDKSLEAGWEGFKVGLMATPVLSMTQAALKVNRGLRDQVLSIADNPEYYKELAKKDPSIKEHLEDITENIDHVANVAKEAETLELSNKQKQDYILNSLSHKIKTAQAESTTNEALKEKYKKEAKNIKERQTAIINGVSEDKVKLNQATKDVKELYDEDLLPRGYRSMLEKIEPSKEGDGKVKFDERKVKSFIEFIGQQANNINAEGKFNEKSDIRKSTKIPDVLKEIADDIFPEFKKTAEEADLATKAEETKAAPTTEDVVPSLKEYEDKKADIEYNRGKELKPINDLAEGERGALNISPNDRESTNIGEGFTTILENVKLTDAEWKEARREIFAKDTKAKTLKEHQEWRKDFEKRVANRLKNEINEKYDAELAALEKQQPQKQSADVVPSLKKDVNLQDEKNKIPESKTGGLQGRNTEDVATSSDTAVESQIRQGISGGVHEKRMFTDTETSEKREQGGSVNQVVDLGGGVKNSSNDGDFILPVDEIQKLRSQNQTDLATGNAIELEKSLDKSGLKESLVVTYYPNEGKAVLTDGHTRLDVAKDMGATKLPVRIVEKYTDAPSNAKDFTPPQQQTKVSPTEQVKTGREIFDQKLPEKVNPYKEPPKEVIDVVTGKGIVDKFGNPASIRSSINLMKKRFDTLDELIKKCL